MRRKATLSDMDEQWEAKLERDRSRLPIKGILSIKDYIDYLLVWRSARVARAAAKPGGRKGRKKSGDCGA